MLLRNESANADGHEMRTPGARRLVNGSRGVVIGFDYACPLRTDDRAEAGGGGEAGGGDCEAVVARMLAIQVFALIEHVPSSKRILELKDICRNIRLVDPQVSCREPTSNHPSLRPARPDHPCTATVVAGDLRQRSQAGEQGARPHDESAERIDGRARQAA